MGVFLLAACGGGIELTNKQNNAPVAQNDAIETLEDNSIIIEKLLLNDNDADADELTISAFSSPAHGALSKTDDGSIQYTPHQDYFGDDSFDYSISDGRGGTHSASVAITVNGVNDAPIVSSRKNFVFTPDMIGALLRLTELNIVQDIDSNKLQFELLEPPTHGEFSLTEDGTFTYTPVAGFEGDDKFVFRVSDAEYSVEGELTIEVAHVNDAPFATDDVVTGSRIEPVDILNVLENDNDIDGDQLYVTGWTQPDSGTINYLGKGKFEYTPNSETVSGIQSFEYTISDGSGAESTASVKIEIEAGWGHSTTHSLFADWSSQVADEEGNITLIWTTINKKGEFNLWARHYDNSKNRWLDATQIDNENDGTITDIPELYIDSTGNVTVIWQQMRDQFKALFSNRFNKKDNNWRSAATHLSTDTTINKEFADVVQVMSIKDKEDNIGIIWLQSAPGIGPDLYKIHYLRYDPSGSLGEIHKSRNYVSIDSASLTNGEQTRIAINNGTIAFSWLEDDANITGGKSVHAGIFSTAYNNRWNDNTILVPAKSSGEIPSVPYLLIDQDGNIDAFWEETKMLDPNTVEARNLWSTHFTPDPNESNQNIGTWSAPVQANTSGVVQAGSLTTIQLSDENDNSGVNIFATWTQTADTSTASPESLWTIAKTLDKELIAKSASSISSLSSSADISNLILKQSQNFAVAIWLQDDGEGNNLWSNRLTLDENGLLSQSLLDAIEFKNGDIHSLQVISDSQQNLTALWIQDVISPATGDVTISVMAQHFSKGYWLINDASFVSTQLNMALEYLGAPSAIQATTTNAGDVIVAWEHKNIKHSDSFNEVWTNTLSYSGIEPQWKTARQLNKGSTFDSHLQTLTTDKNGRALVIWSEFNDELDHLLLKELNDVDSGWTRQATTLGIDGQYDTSVVDVSFNEDQQATITGFNKSQTSGPRTLWSINYR